MLDASVDRQEVTVGEAVELTVEVENTAEERSEFALQVRNDGRLERTETFTVPANETTTLRMSYRVTEPGDHTIEANRIEAGTVRAVAADGESAEALFGGGMLPVLVVLVLAGGTPTLVGYARYRGWTTSDRPGHPPSRATARGRRCSDKHRRAGPCLPGNHPDPGGLNGRGAAWRRSRHVI